eukprot:Clim_evm19s145 gene=Clim_evmTU19s145
MGGGKGDTDFFTSELDTGLWLELLGSMVNEGEHLVNNPPAKVPKEDRAGRYVMEALQPYRDVLKIEQFSYAENRTNIVITYEGTDPNLDCSFVGSHMDVVDVELDKWKFEPFKFEEKDGIVYGRGTTDCLGHVALQCCLFQALARCKPKLKRSIRGVLIVDEEAGGDSNISVERLWEDGKLPFLKNGPFYWLDCADMMPNVGSGGCVSWRLTTTGVLCHSGFPNKGINAIEVGSWAMRRLQRAFYRAFPICPEEKEYGFEMSSSFKPTRVEACTNSLNQIPDKYVLEGDIRLIPFFDIRDAMKVLEVEAAQFSQPDVLRLFANNDPAKDWTGSHDSHAILKEDQDKSGIVAEIDMEKVSEAKIELEWLNDPVDGLACDLHSEGFKAMESAVTSVLGSCHTLADTGTLPLVGNLRKQGLDVQTIGFGVEDAYHAHNEFARVKDFQNGYRILIKIIENLESM